MPYCLHGIVSATYTACDECIRAEEAEDYRRLDDAKEQLRSNSDDVCAEAAKSRLERAKKQPDSIFAAVHAEESVQRLTCLTLIRARLRNLEQERKKVRARADRQLRDLQIYLQRGGGEEVRRGDARHTYRLDFSRWPVNSREPSLTYPE